MPSRIPSSTDDHSLWLDEAREALGPLPPLDASIRADVCIAGGGYTGLWTALRIKELDPSADVVVLERDRCGSGASGRNGGFVLTWWAKFGTLAKTLGTEEAVQLGRASAQAVVAVGEFAAAHAPDAGYRRDGWLWAATNPAQLGSWRPTVEALERAGERPFEEVGAEEAARRTGSPVHLGGVLEATGAIVQPALLAAGLRRVALERGVRLFERTEVTGLDHTPADGAGGPSGVVVRAGQVSVRAGAVVVAMNAWAVRFAEVRRRIVVVGSDIVATEPIPARLAELGWSDGLCISDSRLLVHYYRTTGDGRIAFGKGGGALGFGRHVGERFDGPSTRHRDVEASFVATYPTLGDVRIDRSWTGPVDRSRSGLPYFSSLGGRPNVVVGVGYSGNGVGPAWVGGRILASLALGRDDEWSTCGLVVRRGSGRHASGPANAGTFPPEPARFVGGQMVRAAIARAERDEDRGRTPSRLDRALVRLAPAGLVPVRKG
jgi:glycine/D-amino acid oxidase-like deaminating enzyme